MNATGERLLLLVPALALAGVVALDRPRARGLAPVAPPPVVSGMPPIASSPLVPSRDAAHDAATGARR